MISITGTIDMSHYKTLLSNGSVSITADEKEIVGGAGQGLNPSELLAASLASCTCITLRMYADRKAWMLESIATTVKIENAQITRTIQLTGALDEEQTNRLMEIAEHCPIHKLLQHPIPIQTIQQ